MNASIVVPPWRGKFVPWKGEVKGPIGIAILIKMQTTSIPTLNPLSSWIERGLQQWQHLCILYKTSNPWSIPTYCKIMEILSILGPELCNVIQLSFPSNWSVLSLIKKLSFHHQLPTPDKGACLFIWCILFVVCTNIPRHWYWTRRPLQCQG